MGKKKSLVDTSNEREDKLEGTSYRGAWDRLVRLMSRFFP